MKVTVETPNAPAAVGPYSQGIKANGFLFLSGQIPIDPQTGQISAIDIVGQTKQVMENLSAVLNSQGLMVADIVKITIFMTDLADFGRVNEVYGSYFPTDPPARSTIQVAALPRGAKIEIEAVAALR